MRFIRRSDSRMLLPASSGVAPPMKPVLPPCGTTTMSCASASAMTCETCSVVSGITTASDRPRYWPCQSVRKDSVSVSPVFRPASPTMAWRAAMISADTAGVSRKRIFKTDYRIAVGSGRGQHAGPPQCQESQSERGAAARRSLSFTASPSPVPGTGATPITVAPVASAACIMSNRLAAAS